VDSSGATVRAVKGAFAAVTGLAPPPPDASTTADQLEVQGFRVLARRVGPPEALKVPAGIIRVLSEPPRNRFGGRSVAEVAHAGVAAP